VYTAAPSVHQHGGSKEVQPLDFSSSAWANVPSALSPRRLRRKSAVLFEIKTQHTKQDGLDACTKEASGKDFRASHQLAGSSAYSEPKHTQHAPATGAVALGSTVHLWVTRLSQLVAQASRQQRINASAAPAGLSAGRGQEELQALMGALIDMLGGVLSATQRQQLLAHWLEWALEFSLSDTAAPYLVMRSHQIYRILLHLAPSACPAGASETLPQDDTSTGISSQQMPADGPSLVGLGQLQRQLQMRRPCTKDNACRCCSQCGRCASFMHCGCAQRALEEVSPGNYAA
jgi:hypothetical protein